MKDDYYDVSVSASGALQIEQPIFGFGFLKDALGGLLGGGGGLKEPVKSGNGKNFFDAPGVTIDNKKLAKMG